jgi:F-type H+-transporting ATPase subunit beta
MKQAGVLPNMVMVFGQMNELARQSLPRWARGADDGGVFSRRPASTCVLLIDNIFRFIQAAQKFRASWAIARGWAANRRWARNPRLEERIANTDTGASHLISRLPASAHLPKWTWGNITVHYVDRSIAFADRKVFPAIDSLQSHSKMSNPAIVGERHYRVAREIRRVLAQYEELKDIMAMLGLDQLSAEDRNTVFRARRLERFLTQPFFTTEQFTGMKGKTVPLEQALEGCERILNDEFKDVQESALYMIGAIDEAKPKEML